MLFDLTSNITKYLTSSDMNYLALLSVCAAYAPDFFYVYNLSDWFQEERSLKLKSRMWFEPRTSPPIWMSTLVRNRLLADDKPSQVSRLLSSLFPSSILSFKLPSPFPTSRKLHFLGPQPMGYVSLQIWMQISVLMCFLKRNLNLHLFWATAFLDDAKFYFGSKWCTHVLPFSDNLIYMYSKTIYDMKWEKYRKLLYFRISLLDINDNSLYCI